MHLPNAAVIVAREPSAAVERAEQLLRKFASFALSPFHLFDAMLSVDCILYAVLPPALQRRPSRLALPTSHERYFSQSMCTLAA